MSVYSENRTKPITTVCGQTAELLIVKAGGSCSYHWVYGVKDGAYFNNILEVAPYLQENMPHIRYKN
jgi:hypothetical protein